jgi:hypothetical protein
MSEPDGNPRRPFKELGLLNCLGVSKLNYAPDHPSSPAMHNAAFAKLKPLNLGKSRRSLNQ